MGFMSAMLGGMGMEPDKKNSTYGDHDYLAQQQRAGIAGAQNRVDPRAQNTQLGAMQNGQAATIDQTQQAQVRGQQQQLNQQMMQVALGNQQGAGELAAQRAGARAVANQQAMAASARGGGAALAGLGAARGAMDIGQQTQGAMQTAGLQDRAQANQTLTSALGQTRQQDLGLASDQAQLNQQVGLANQAAQNQGTLAQGQMNQATSLANLQAQLQARGMNDQAIQAYMQNMTGMNQAEMQARLQQEQTAMSQTGIGGSLLSAAGQIGAAYATGGGSVVAGAMKK